MSKWTEKIVILLLLLLTTVQQLRLTSVEHHLNELYKSHLNLEHEITEFMGNVNSSINNNTQSIESHTRILKMLIH